MNNLASLILVLALTKEPVPAFEKPYAPQRELLVQAVLEESNNQPFAGKIAVAGVILDRTVDRRWPSTIRGVIFQPYQFSYVGKAGRHYFSPRDVRQARLAVLLARMGERPCGRVLAFHATYIKRPKQWLTVKRKCRIADHIFYEG